MCHMATIRNGFAAEWGTGATVPIQAPGARRLRDADGGVEQFEGLVDGGEVVRGAGGNAHEVTDGDDFFVRTVAEATASVEDQANDVQVGVGDKGGIGLVAGCEADVASLVGIAHEAGGGRHLVVQYAGTAAQVVEWNDLAWLGGDWHLVVLRDGSFGTGALGIFDCS